MDDFNTIREMIGVKLVAETGYALPPPHIDSLDASIGIHRYTLAKTVLENPQINNILKRMNAFDVLNPYEIDSYYDMAKSITEAMHVYNTENMETNWDITFPLHEDDPSLTDFGTEFIIELYTDKFNTDISPDNDGTDMGNKFTTPQQSDGWIEKIMSKFGFKNMDIKDLLYLYLINHYNHGEEENNSGSILNRVKSGSPQLNPQMGECMRAIMDEPIPYGVSGWINNVEHSFITEHGDKWENALFEALLHQYYPDNPSIPPTVVEADDATLNAEQPKIKSPKVPPTVKTDVKSRIKELDKLISQYEDKTHFRGDVKPAIFNAKKALTYIMDKLNAGDVNSFKEAQLHFQKLMSPITNLFPPSLVRFLATGSVRDNATLKTVND